jgi:hypothetical protein
MTCDDVLLREPEFEGRRRRVLRAMGVFVWVSAAGLGVVIAVRALAPGAFDRGVMVFVGGFALSGLALWRTARRHWRCPACDARWELSDVLASRFWNHCARCGVALRAARPPTAREDAARARFEAEGLAPDELARRFRQQQRRSGLAAAALCVAGVATLAGIAGRGLPEWVEQGVVAGFAGIVLAVVVTGARCPRCRRGVLAGPGSHCPRCGLAPGLRDPRSSAGSRACGTRSSGWSRRWRRARGSGSPRPGGS